MRALVEVYGNAGGTVFIALEVLGMKLMHASLQSSYIGKLAYH